MSSDNKSTQKPNKTGRSAWRFFWSIISFGFKLFFSLVLSWLISILIEVVGMTFIWEDEGVGHSQRILTAEIGYIQSDYLKSKYTADPEAKVLVRAAKAYEKVDEYTKSEKIFDALGEYGQAMKNTTIIFLIRLSVTVSILLLYVLLTIWAINEGLLMRAKRKWSGAVERSYVFHHLKGALFWVIILPIPIYLMLPFAVHPMAITAPFMAIYCALLVTSIGFFKKVL